ncbi:MAG: hypothetical protein Q8O25_13065 [Sulfurisoma sp.]|nr:hypothetical protein [Sulfurisoma sp.]
MAISFSFMGVTIMRFAALLLSVVFFALPARANAQQMATYDMSSSYLTLPAILVDSSTSFQDVVVHLLSLGTVRVGDPSVGTQIEFVSSTNTLRLPLVSVAGTQVAQVSLVNPALSLVSVGGITVNPPASGNYALDITVSALGIPVPAIRINNVSKPGTESDFCSASNYEEFQQSLQSVSGSWSITSCSFNGTGGQISATLTVTDPFPITVPYTVAYTYSPM